MSKKLIYNPENPQGTLVDFTDAELSQKVIDDEKTAIRKTEFNEIMEDHFWGPIVDNILKDAMIKKMGTSDGVDIDTESYEDIRSLAAELDM